MLTFFHTLLLDLLNIMNTKQSLQKIKLSLLFIVLSVAVQAQNPYRLAAGARQAGLAYTSIATEGFWASFHNQASLGMERNLSLGLNHESRFGIAELSNKTFGLIIPCLPRRVQVGLHPCRQLFAYHHSIG